MNLLRFNSFLNTEIASVLEMPVIFTVGNSGMMRE